MLQVGCRLIVKYQGAHESDGSPDVVYEPYWWHKTGNFTDHEFLYKKSKKRFLMVERNFYC